MVATWGTRRKNWAVYEWAQEETMMKRKTGDAASLVFLQGMAGKVHEGELDLVQEKWDMMGQMVLECRE